LVYLAQENAKELGFSEEGDEARFIHLLLSVGYW
jgi:hypothetical protein